MKVEERLLGAGFQRQFTSKKPSMNELLWRYGLASNLRLNSTYFDSSLGQIKTCPSCARCARAFWSIQNSFKNDKYWLHQLFDARACGKYKFRWRKMEIISQVVGALIAVAVSLITTFASAKFLLKRETAKLEYFKSRFGPTYHVLIDTWDSLKFIHTLIEEEVKWDAETKWQHLFRFHSYQWTLKTDHLPDLKYLVSKKMLSEWDRLMLIGIMNHFDYLFHRYLSRQKHIPEEEYVKSEEFHYGKVFIRQIEIPTIDARARRGIKRLENELKLQHEKKNIEDALEILKEVINSLAEKI